ncbi:MAG TPA: hypothetical protein DHW49_00830 [Anaerolineae bacterium]|nr:hypothetical protein [Anaerolineae bacterium]
MKKTIFSIAISLVLLFTLISPAIANQNVYAQAGGPGCIDPATGGTIECTPTPQPGGGSGDGGGSGSGGGNRNPTNTPLPITNPSEDGSNDAKEIGCGGSAEAVANCVGKYVLMCIKAGGKADTTVTGENSAQVSCTKDAFLVIEPTPLSVVNPTDDGATEAKGATCKGGTTEWRLTCALGFATECTNAGGESTIKTVGNSIEIDCTKDAFLVIDPTPYPITSGPAEDDLIGTCSQAQGNVSSCLAELQRQCEDGLLVIEVDLYATGGTSYKVYCIPHEELPTLDLPYKLPDNDGSTEDNWTGGCYGNDVDKCVNDLASLCESDGGELSVWYDNEGGAGVHCENQSDAGQVAPTATPLVVVSPDEDNSSAGDSWEEECSWASCWLSDLSCWMDGGSGYVVEDSVGNTGYHCDLPSQSSNAPPFGFGFLIGVFAAVAIPAFMKNARRAKTAEAVTNVKKMYDASDSMPQTKEHILLNKDDNSQSANKPKPTPKPTPPPSKPKPSSGPKGDINSDGDVDGSDFNP